MRVVDSPGFWHSRTAKTVQVYEEPAGRLYIREHGSNLRVLRVQQKVMVVAV